MTDEEGLLLCGPIEPTLHDVGASGLSAIALFDARLLPIAAVHGGCEVFIGRPRPFRGAPHRKTVQILLYIPDLFWYNNRRI
jgi:hypothetical protein